MGVRFVFYNEDTGEIYSVRNFKSHAQAEQNCRANRRFNMTCAKESVIGFVANPNTSKVNVSVTPHVVEAKTITPPAFCHELRTQRNMRLSRSDWTQGADSPLTDAKKAEWATYRQALRDMVCEDYNGWAEVTWPAKPS